MKKSLFVPKVQQLPEKRQPPTPARLESFSDSVISVVLTIMVLNLRLPVRDGLGGLQEILPVIAIYLLSFAFTGIYWLNHQQLTRRLQAAGYYLQIANLAFLFCLSLLPFSTYCLIARRVTPDSVQQYAGTLLSIATAFYFMRWAVHKHLKLHGRMTELDRRANLRHLASLLIYLSCIPPAAWDADFTVLVLGCNTLAWALPGLSPHLLRLLTSEQERNHGRPHSKD